MFGEQQKTLRRAERRREQIASQCGLTARMIRVALGVYCLSNFAKDCAAEFALQARKKRRLHQLGDMSAEEMAAKIGQWFVDADFEEVASVFAPQTRVETGIRFEAAKFVSEWRTVRWVSAENFARGRAPLQCGVFNSFAIQMQTFGLTPRFSLDLPRQGRGPRLNRAARKWCQRMRSKWGLRRRSLLDAEPLGREEVENKARGVLVCCDDF